MKMKIHMTMAVAALVLGGWTLGAIADDHPPGEYKGPELSVPDLSGAIQTLQHQAGKIVVLEWTNYDCPFVKKHYSAGNMQELQKRYTGKGVVWWTICSSAEGKQGYYTAEKWKEMVEESGAASTATLLDVSGEAGRALSAKTTPHMFVIDRDGSIAYRGAIDNIRSTDPDDIEGAENFVAAALDALLQGEKVKVSKTAPYGCSVKY